MDIYCNHSRSAKNVNYNSTSISKKLNELNLKQIKTLNLNNFFKNKKTKLLFFEIAENLFSTENIYEISKALIYSFFIVRDDFNIKVPDKMKILASKINLYLNSNLIIDDNFYLIFDRYYTYFQEYINTDNYQILENKFKELTDMIRSYQFLNNNNNNNNNDKLNDLESKIIFCIKYLFSINIFFTFNNIMTNFNLFKNTIFKEKIWSMVLNLLEGVNKYEILLTLLIYVKSSAIKKINEPFTKKKIYYEIDIDEFSESVIIGDNLFLKMYNSFIKIDNILKCELKNYKITELIKNDYNKNIINICENILF